MTDERLKKTHAIRTILVSNMVGSFESAIVKAIAEDILQSLEAEHGRAN